MISKSSRQAALRDELVVANQICDLKHHDLVAVIEELKQIKYVKIDGKWKMKDALTKRQRELLQELKLDLSFMYGTESQVAERTTH